MWWGVCLFISFWKNKSLHHESTGPEVVSLKITENYPTLKISSETGFPFPCHAEKWRRLLLLQHDGCTTFFFLLKITDLPFLFAFQRQDDEYCLKEMLEDVKNLRRLEKVSRSRTDSRKTATLREEQGKAKQQHQARAPGTSHVNQEMCFFPGLPPAPLTAEHVSNWNTVLTCRF